MMNVEVELSTFHKPYQCNFGHCNNITRDKKCEMKFYKSENIISKNSNLFIQANYSLYKVGGLHRYKRGLVDRNY